MHCKDCKYFNNKKPVSTGKGNGRYKSAEDYIGECEQTGRIKMMNDECYTKRSEKQ